MEFEDEQFERDFQTYRSNFTKLWYETWETFYVRQQKRPPVREIMDVSCELFSLDRTKFEGETK